MSKNYLLRYFLLLLLLSRQILQVCVFFPILGDCKKKGTFNREETIFREEEKAYTILIIYILWGKKRERPTELKILKVIQFQYRKGTNPSFRKKSLISQIGFPQGYSTLPPCSGESLGLALWRRLIASGGRRCNGGGEPCPGPLLPP